MRVIFWSADPFGSGTLAFIYTIFMGAFVTKGAKKNNFQRFFTENGKNNGMKRRYRNNRGRYFMALGLDNAATRRDSMPGNHFWGCCRREILTFLPNVHLVVVPQLVIIASSPPIPLHICGNGWGGRVMTSHI